MTEELQLMIYYNLVLESPVLSGNMQNMIDSLGLYGLDPVNNESRILITAPSYDTKKWRKEQVIVHDYKFNYDKMIEIVIESIIRLIQS